MITKKINVSFILLILICLGFTYNNVNGMTSTEMKDSTDIPNTKTDGTGTDRTGVDGSSTDRTGTDATGTYKSGTNSDQPNLNEINFEGTKLAPEANRRMMNDVFTNYLLVRNSLAAGNSADAKTQTMQLLDQIDKNMSSYDQSMFKESQDFTNNLSTIRTRLNDASTIEDQRVIFNDLNNNLMNYIKTYGLFDRTIYLVQCNDNSNYGNGYWFTDSMTDYVNPYSGNTAGKDCYNVRESWNFK